ncbi:LOW QUALITY PROTEIN: microtubule-actin cross-linking factor 1, isoforms 1/2/3/5-like [Lingula anatina]|uniref:LOW QUALITY PROTEIN: microtubule-actin cross-linking factor 1, isoforms 1/2/3/5-like n=1 Tax=Lingula anatina TaxID=7574 RepID=A0A1S3HMN7_LINAN|nr:LOW QUALITY PROTEIN: microtubule-actin cross-linking factor 1, isoforms 1/2/3/5-like [Lingula anatina]|eukprot:XP_013386319.2 LOW QUALITY PROTEIN: microtubule-actin cross-linking factor 1, isoforms 1/2/3/5-like [Lingula anatina]
MGSKKVVSSLEDCMIWIQQEQKNLREAAFGNTLVALKEETEKQRKKHALITEFKGFMEKIRSKKYTEEEVGNMDTAYDSLLTLSLERQKCLESLTKIVEIEELFQKVSAEVDTRALELVSQQQEVNEQILYDANTAKTYQSCMGAVKKSWSWLSDLTWCMEVHESHAAEYHKFFHEVKHYEDSLAQFISEMSKSTREKYAKQNKNVQQQILDIRETTRRLLELQTTVETLFERSGTIVPLKWRKEMPPNPLKMKALAAYEHKDFVVAEDDEVTLLDNTHGTKWKVRSASGVESIAPAILFLIPSPDSEAVDKANGLRQRMVNIWEHSLRTLRSQTLRLLTRVINGVDSSELGVLNPAQTQDVMKLLKDSLRKLRIDEPGGADLRDFLHSIHSFAKLLQDSKVDQDEGRRHSATKFFVEWKQVEKMVDTFEELAIYADDYTNTVDKSSNTKYYLCFDDEGKLRWCSNGYIERMKHVELDTDIPLTIEHNEVQLMIIFEKAQDDDEEQQSDMMTVSSALETIEEEMFSSDFMRESQTFSITGVLDPRTDEIVSIFSAVADGIVDRKDGVYRNPVTGESMPIPEAMNRGFIIVEYVNRTILQQTSESGVIKTVKTRSGKTYKISAVVDPRNNQKLNANDAMDAGILDPKKGRYINPTTGESMSIDEAVQHGFILLAAENGHVSDEDDLFITQSYLIMSVVDPRTKKDVSLKVALASGIVNKEQGVYKNLDTGMEIMIAEAIMRGFIKAKPIDSTANHNSADTITIKLRKPKEGRKQPIEDKSYHKLKDEMDMTIDGIKESGVDGSRDLNLEEALRAKIMALEALEYATNNGDRYTLQEAVAMGYVDPKTATQILRECEARSLDNPLSSGELDPHTSLFVDPTTGLKVRFRSAVADGYLDPYKIYYYDIPEQKVSSLGRAISDGKFNEDTGRFIDPSTGNELSITAAVEKQLIDPRVDSEAIMDRTDIKHLEPHMDTNITGVKHPITNQDLSVKEAVLSGLLDIPEVAYVNADQDESFGVAIPEAVTSGNIATETAKEIFKALDAMSLGAMHDQKLLDEDGNYVDPKTKQKMTIEEAVDNGHFDPNYVFFVDKIGNEVVTLAVSIDQGQFNPQTGKFVDPSGRDISISIAAKRDLINPRINPEEFIEERFTLQELQAKGKAYDDSILKIPGRPEMTLRQALDENLLSPQTVLCYDPKTGTLSLPEVNESLKTLMDISYQLKWVGEKEVELGMQKPPSEDSDELRKQADDQEDLLKDVENHQDPIELLLEQAQELLENAKNSSRDEASEHQYQKLRFATSDLKLRFEAVYSQAEARMKLLEALLHQLQDFYENLESFDEWLTQGEQTIGEMQKALTDLDNLQQHSEAFKSFADEAMLKESNLSELMNEGSQFKNDSQDYEKGLEVFREGIHLQRDNSGAENDEAARVIDQELQAVNEKYKALLTNCMGLMAQLTDTVEKCKEFKEIQAELQDWFPETEEQIANVKPEEVEPEPEKIQKEIELLSIYNADVASQGKLVDDLKSVGGELVDFLESNETKDKAQEIATVVALMEGRYNAIQDQYDQKNAQLNQMLVQSQDISHGIDVMLTWLEDTENRLQCLPPVSLNKENLNQQLHEHRVLQSEINNRRTHMETLAKQAEGVPGTESKLNEAHDRFEKIQEAMKARADDQDDVMSKMGNIQRSVQQVETWIGSTVGVLKKATEIGTFSAKDKIEELYRQKQAKQTDLDEIKHTGKELVDSPKTGDKNSLRETIADVHAKWHSLTEMLVQLISMEALQEIDEAVKFLDKAEAEINTSDPISIEPETLSVQLRNQQALHAELDQKKNGIRDLVNKCNVMLRDTTSEEADNVKNRLEQIRSQADSVCKLSEDRLRLLEDASPLVRHFNDVQSDLRVWLTDVESEIQGLDAAGQSADQIKKQQEQVKNTQRLIEERKPQIENLNEGGQELMGVCSDEHGSQVQDTLLNINSRYEDVKAAVREKINELDDAFRQATSEVTDALDSLSEELQALNDQIAHADPVPTRPEPLKEQIAESQNVLEDVDRRRDALVNAKDAAAAFIAQVPEEDRQAEAQELKHKITELEQLHDTVKAAANVRSRTLEEALNVGEQFWANYGGLMDTLKELQDNLNSQDSPHVEPESVKEQQKELYAIKEEFEKTKTPIQECRQTADYFSSLVGEPGKVEVKKAMEDMDENMENLEDGIKEREEELDNAFEKGKSFEQTFQDINSWLPKFEENLARMGPVAAEKRSIKIQIEELKVLKLQAHARDADIEKLNTQAAELKAMSPLAADGVLDTVKEMNGRWANLVKGIADRETRLQESLVSLGELDHALDDVIGFLTHAEQVLTQQDDVNGDHKHIEASLRKLQLLQRDINKHGAMVTTLSEAVEAVAARNATGAPALKDKQEEMNELWKAVNIYALEKQNQLQDLLKAAKAFIGEVEDVLHWLRDYKLGLKRVKPLGALPETAKKQYDKFMTGYNHLHGKEDQVKMILLNGEDMISRCKRSDVIMLREMLAKLRFRWDDTTKRAEKEKKKIEIHMQAVNDFHASLNTFTDWLANAENVYASFTYPSKIVERVTKQIKDHKDVYDDLKAHAGIMQSTDRNGTYLKYFGRKHDTVYLNNLLTSVRLRWKKLVRRTEERGRLLTQAYKEDKRFYDSWKDLCDWLDDTEKKLLNFSAQKSPAEVKQFMDDLKPTHKLKNGRPMWKQIQLERLVSPYHSCNRQEKNRQIAGRLSGNNEHILMRSIWNSLCYYFVNWGMQFEHRINQISPKSISILQAPCITFAFSICHLLHHDGVPGRNPEDVTHFIFLHYEHQISSKHPQYYTTTRLGRNLKDRCTRNDQDRETLQEMLDELKNKWTIVRSLVSQRQSKLDEALLMSGRLSDALQSLMEWLTRAETALTEDQNVAGDIDTVNILIEQHKSFQQELDARQSTINTLKDSSHGDPALTSQLEHLDRKWEEVNHLSNMRESRLQDALKLAEEFQEVVHVMREWLPQAEAELKVRALPEDEVEIVELIERHEAFMEELTGKKQIIERIKELSDEILQNCHPNAVRFVRYYLTITSTRWEQALTRAENRTVKLQEALKNIRGNAALLEELLAWVTEAQALVSAKEKDPIPEDMTVVEALLKEHVEFHEDLVSKNTDVERIANMPIRGYKRRESKGAKTPEAEMIQNPRLTTLQNKWRAVWRMSVERKKKLQDLYEHLLELESFKNFDFDLWRQRYINWIKAKKFRITDFFRRQDKKGDGLLPRADFVDGMMNSKFPTTRTELNAVFDIFDRDNKGEIDYREFIEALNPRSKRAKRPATDAEQIHDEIERQCSTCTCRTQFKSEKLGEGKYQLGESRKVVLVRFLNHTVMVRVGGGWVTLGKFLETHDPCRAKGRLNTELREQLVSPEGAAHTRATFTSKRPGQSNGHLLSPPTPASNPRSGTTAKGRNSSGCTSSSSSSSSRSSGIPVRSGLQQPRNLASTRHISSSLSRLSGHPDPYGHSSSFQLKPTGFTHSSLTNIQEAAAGNLKKSSSNSSLASTGSSGSRGSRTPRMSTAKTTTKKKGSTPGNK